MRLSLLLLVVLLATYLLPAAAQDHRQLRAKQDSRRRILFKRAAAAKKKHAGTAEYKRVAAPKKGKRTLLWRLLTVEPELDDPRTVLAKVNSNCSQQGLKGLRCT